jgi:hypothetical protein
VITLTAELNQTSSEYEAQGYPYICDIKVSFEDGEGCDMLTLVFVSLRKTSYHDAGERNRVRIVCNGGFCKLLRNPEPSGTTTRGTVVLICFIEEHTEII